LKLFSELDQRPTAASAVVMQSFPHQDKRSPHVISILQPCNLQRIKTFVLIGLWLFAPGVDVNDSNETSTQKAPVSVAFPTLFDTPYSVFRAKVAVEVNQSQQNCPSNTRKFEELDPRPVIKGSLGLPRFAGRDGGRRRIQQKVSVR